MQVSNAVNIWLLIHEGKSRLALEICWAHVGCTHRLFPFTRLCKLERLNWRPRTEGSS